MLNGFSFFLFQLKLQHDRLLLLRDIDSRRMFNDDAAVNTIRRTARWQWLMILFLYFIAASSRGRCDETDIYKKKKISNVFVYTLGHELELVRKREGGARAQEVMASVNGKRIGREKWAQEKSVIGYLRFRLPMVERPAQVLPAHFSDHS